MSLETQSDRPRRLVEGVAFSLAPGRTLALVGESGSGKSLSALSILRLLPPGIRLARGQITFEDRDLLSLSARDLTRVRGAAISMIFQEPLSCLNPVLTVGRQTAEVLRLHRGVRGSKARRAVVDLFRGVGIAAPERRLDSYPHELSGGMRQRVMIAMALAGAPRILLADEPTTALDATIAAQIIQLLRDIQRRTELALLFITHDLGLVAAIADEVCVLKAGRIVERGTVARVLEAPQEPYTRELLAAVPRL